MIHNRMESRLLLVEVYAVLSHTFESTDICQYYPNKYRAITFNGERHAFNETRIRLIRYSIDDRYVRIKRNTVNPVKEGNGNLYFARRQ